MADDYRAGKAIIPEEKSKELSLPVEMIHRGLELAVRLEQSQGIQPYPQKPVTKEYIVRCYLTLMEWIREDGRSKLSESNKGITNAPVYLVCSFDKDGLHISCASINKKLNYAGIEHNEDRYHLLNSFGNSNPFTIPISSFGLFYKIVSPVEFPQIPKEDQKKYRNVLGPTRGPGYKGPVTKEANPFFNKNKDWIEIVIVYVSLLGDTNLRQGLVAKNPPLKLSFIAIDQKGEDDPAATYELYHVILEAKSAHSAGK